MNRITWRIKDWIVGIVCGWVVVGGHCGICGEWVSDCLVPAYWRITICNKCSKEEA